MRKLLILLLFIFLTPSAFSANELTKSVPAGLVVIQTDFGIKDGAVAAVKGVMYGVDKKLVITDLTHGITPYNIWEAAYRLNQVAAYWPKGTVFVSVVDPGVGTKRRSIVALTKDGNYFVTPDNGTLTLIDANVGIQAVRIIDEQKNRLQGSGTSHTFHGRDVYGYTAAKLASGHISFEQVGPLLNDKIVTLAYKKPYIKNNTLHGTIVVQDPEYGNLWTDINAEYLNQLHVKEGQVYQVKIYQGDREVYSGRIPFVRTFGDVKLSENLLYVNSLLNLAVAINQGNFAKQYGVDAGPEWHIAVQPINH